MTEEHPSGAIESTFRKSVSALKDAGIEFMVGGSLVSWARGGPQTRNDLDFMVRPGDAEHAIEALTAAGMRREDPPEDWLLKAWDGDVLVDIIFRPMGVRIDDGAFARAEELDVLAMRVLVMSLDDVMVSKLLALSDHSLDLEPALQIARSLREQIDWAEVRARTTASPYAAAFFTLLERLGLIGPGLEQAGHGARRSRVRVVSSEGAAG